MYVYMYYIIYWHVYTYCVDLYNKPLKHRSDRYGKWHKC